jgi:2-phospho-L-lactate transferase/gluconeogenesis factor (CofD/UPF0052 family)
MSHSPTLNRGVVVFSGGSAANSLVDVFNTVREKKKCSLSYIIPISDNGGSSSELIRVFGGPGIGDIRSMESPLSHSISRSLTRQSGRLVRLIPESPETSERFSLKNLFNHRLSSISSPTAHAEWYAIVDGTSPLWNGITSAKKELVRSFFNLLNLEIIKRARPSSTFDFTSASVGNLFLTGARLFSGSFESAIYLLASIGGVPDGTHVLPAITSNFSHHIAAGLVDGSTIVGQNSISHPSEPIALEDAPLSGIKPSSLVSPYDHPLQQQSHATPTKHQRRQSSLTLEYQDTIEDANLPGSLPTLRKPYIAFSKEPSAEESLPARIDRIWYINPYGQEIRPPANPRLASTLFEAQAIIYSIGSLYTSIVPSLILRGVGQGIRSSNARHKILILNGSLDREVGPASNPFTAVDFVNAVVKAGEESRGLKFDPTTPAPSANGTSTVTDATLSTSPTASAPPALNELLNLSRGIPLQRPSSPTNPLYKSYITHILYLSGPGCPVVDRQALNSMGIECLRLYGRKNESGTGMRYDGNALVGTLEALMGRKGDAMVAGEGGRSRRNTLEA